MRIGIPQQSAYNWTMIESSPPPSATSDELTTDGGRNEFGENLRKLRKDKKMTLADLATASGIAASTLSRAERGLLGLTYDRLSQLADGLGVDMAELFGTGGASFQKNSLSVARLGEFELQTTPNYTYEMLFSDVWGKAMTPMAGVVKAHSRLAFDDFIRHPGQEFVFVQSGQLTIYTEANEPVTLEAGESAYLDSSMGHVYTSAGDEDARILVVCLGRGDSA